MVSNEGFLCICVCVSVHVCMFLGGAWATGKGEMRLGERGRTEKAAWGRGCEKKGRRTKRTGELLMRASRLALSTNAWTHIHIKGAHRNLDRAWILLHITSPPSLSSSLSATTHNLSLNLVCLFSHLLTSACLLSSVTPYPLHLLPSPSSLPTTQSATESC